MSEIWFHMIPFVFPMGWALMILTGGINVWIREYKGNHQLTDYPECNSNWEEWYAWRPVRDFRGKMHWKTNVYRKIGNTYVDMDDYRWY